MGLLQESACSSVILCFTEERAIFLLSLSVALLQEQARSVKCEVAQPCERKRAHLTGERSCYALSKEREKRSRVYHSAITDDEGSQRWERAARRELPPLRRGDRAIF